MNREDDQQLWDLMGKAAEPKVSQFFARNVLRRVREEPETKSWFGLKILIPAAGLTAVVIAVILFSRNSPVPENLSSKQTATSAATAAPTIAPRPVARVPSSPSEARPIIRKIDPPTVESTESAALARIDPQDYDVVVNLDDLLVLYETSVWDDNSSR